MMRKGRRQDGQNKLSSPLLPAHDERKKLPALLFTWLSISTVIHCILLWAVHKLPYMHALYVTMRWRHWQLLFGLFFSEQSDCLKVDPLRLEMGGGEKGESEAGVHRGAKERGGRGSLPD